MTGALTISETRLSASLHTSGWTETASASGHAPLRMTILSPSRSAPAAPPMPSSTFKAPRTRDSKSSPNEGAPAARLVTLILAVVGANASWAAIVAVVGFVVAALGGFMLFSYHLRRQALPVNYVVIHGAGAVISFVILLAAIFVVRG